MSRRLVPPLIPRIALPGSQEAVTKITVVVQPADLGWLADVLHGAETGTYMRLSVF